MVRELTPRRWHPSTLTFGTRSRQVDAALAIWFLMLYRDLGLKGAASHSGRRTFIAKAAKRVEGVAACGSFSSLLRMKASPTQPYIEGSSDANGASSTQSHKAFSRQIYSPT